MADERETPEAGDPPTGAGFLGGLNLSQKYFAGIAAALTAAAQLWSLVEKQWLSGAVTLLLVGLVVAFYAVFHRRVSKVLLSPEAQHEEKTRRSMMIGLLIAIPFVSLIWLYSYSYLPRALESGTTVAVARFQGLPLPEPYQDCRPSDMLVQTLSRVGDRFGNLRVFELPYTIDPDDRWAEWWAKAHGAFEGADIVVYGEYTLYSSKGSKDPDKIVLDPEIARVPTIPLGFKAAAPLYSWEFPGSAALISELCSSDLSDVKVARPPHFLDDARRLAEAVVGLQALGIQDYEVAQDSLKAAKQPENSDKERCKGQIDKDDPTTLQCPGVLAFYLGMLDARLGQNDDAVQEYSYAARKLGSAAPFINRGELFERSGKRALATRDFNRAINADPTSVASIGTRAFYDEKPKQAALDLAEAMRLRPTSLYDELVLSRAVYQQARLFSDEKKDDYTNCGIKILKQLVESRSFNDDLNVATLAQYGDWLRKKHDDIMDPHSMRRRDPAAVAEAAAALNDATKELNQTLEFDPRNVLANYDLGLIYEHSPNDVDAERYLREAEFAPAFTDDDYLTKANSAIELMNSYDGGDTVSRKTDYNVALIYLSQSIHLNPGAAYTFYARAELERTKDPAQATLDAEAALRLLPYAGRIRDICENLPNCKIYERKHNYAHVVDPSGPSRTWQAVTWSAKDCKYRDLDFRV
jgi:tetratricopeptide (TPR) repeat protein